VELVVMEGDLQETMVVQVDLVVEEEVLLLILKLDRMLMQVDQELAVKVMQEVLDNTHQEYLVNKVVAVEQELQEKMDAYLIILVQEMVVVDQV
jgi:predicted nucleic acid-binding protein